MDSIEVRIATEADIPLIHDLAHRIWPVAYAEMISREQMDYMLEWMYAPDALRSQMTDEGCAFFIATQAELSVGFASVSMDGPQAKLNKLYVLVDQHGKGMGKALLKAAMEHARKNGCEEMVLQVNKRNVSRAFYSAQDFSIVEEAVFDIGRGFVMDDYIMRRSL